MNLSDSAQNAFSQQMVMSADGTKATAVWTRSDGTNNVIQSRSAKIIDGVITWGAVSDLSDNTQTAFEPRIAMSSDGTKVTVAWYRSNGTNNVVQVRSATIAAGVATWGGVSDISDGTQNATSAQVALSADGSKATVVWVRSNGANDIVQARSATVSSAVASWGAVSDLSDTLQNAAAPQIALSADGTKGTAVWSRSNGTKFVVQSASATIATNVATWAAETDVSDDTQSAVNPQVRLSTDGTKTTLAWSRSDGTHSVIQSRSATIAAAVPTWGAVADLSDSTQDAFDPRLALSADGTKAAAVWYWFNGTRNVIVAKTATIATAASTWSAAVTLSDTAQPAYGQQIAMSTDGTKAVAIWLRSDGTNDLVQTKRATIAAGVATWGSVVTLSGAGQDAEFPQVALSSTGSAAVAAWDRSNGTKTVVQAVAALTPQISPSGGDPAALIWAAAILLGAGALFVGVRRRTASTR